MSRRRSGSRSTPSSESAAASSTTPLSRSSATRLLLSRTGEITGRWRGWSTRPGPAWLARRGRRRAATPGLSGPTSATDGPPRRPSTERSLLQQPLLPRELRQPLLEALVALHERAGIRGPALLGEDLGHLGPGQPLVDAEDEQRLVLDVQG